MLKQFFCTSNCFNKWKILGDKTVASEAMFEAFLLFLWLLQHHRAMSAPSASIYLPSPRYPVTALTITSGPALQKPGCGFILQPAGGRYCAVQPLFLSRHMRKPGCGFIRPVEPDIRSARMTVLGVHPSGTCENPGRTNPHPGFRSV